MVPSRRLFPPRMPSRLGLQCLGIALAPGTWFLTGAGCATSRRSRARRCRTAQRGSASCHRRAWAGHRRLFVRSCIRSSRWLKPNEKPHWIGRTPSATARRDVPTRGGRCTSGNTSTAASWERVKPGQWRGARDGRWCTRRSGWVTSLWSSRMRFGESSEGRVLSREAGVESDRGHCEVAGRERGAARAVWGTPAHRRQGVLHAA